MKLAKVRSAGEEHVALLEGDKARLLRLPPSGPYRKLADILFATDLRKVVASLDADSTEVRLDELEFLAPIDMQEVWAAGVTYKRSQVARMEESDAAATHYDHVYTAPRPEIFFKATPNRVTGPGQPVRVRYDSGWSVPEPELTLAISPDGRLVGFTIGNDMSARDIEGENPLYLPQAKMYHQCCGLGPCVLVAESPLDPKATEIKLTIERDKKTAYQGETRLDQMARSFDELITWLRRENEFPNGVFLLTGTGIVPPDDFTLEDGDVVSIEITGIGTLTNPVVKNSAN